MLRHYLRYSFQHREYWASIKICIRNGYTIADGSMWRDMIELLRHFGKDTNSPKYVCPQDLNAEHDKWVEKRNRQKGTAAVEGTAAGSEKTRKRNTAGSKASSLASPLQTVH